MLVMEDLSDDDSSYSNSTYSSFCFWSIEACGAWIPQFGVVTVYAATPPTDPFAVAKYIAPTRYVPPL